MSRNRRAKLGAGQAAIRGALLHWYDTNKRDLPWRRSRDPYRIWVAEVMLQQTRIEVVAPAYRRFLRAFPSIARLAAAEEEAVLAAWSGLGYYTRARSLHRAARVLAASHSKAFPCSMAEALALPGVGSYTAAAVLSIAYDLPFAAVDGNVVRVLSRLACLPAPDSRGEPQRSLAQQLLSPQRPGDWNQALMELGQTICLPRNPLCERCPLARNCEARERHATERYPKRSAGRPIERVPITITLLRDRAVRLLLERGAFPYLVHLWLPPVRFDSQGPPSRKGRGFLGSFRHAIQNRIFDVRVTEQILTPGQIERRCRTASGASVERRLFDRKDIHRIGRSALLTKALKLLPA